MLGNLARPVSRGERGSDAPALPDCVVAAPSARLFLLGDRGRGERASAHWGKEEIRAKSDNL